MLPFIVEWCTWLEGVHDDGIAQDIDDPGGGAATFFGPDILKKIVGFSFGYHANMLV